MKGGGLMDKKKDEKSRNWLPEHMPCVARLMSEKRQQFGAAHVQECWRRSVVLGEAGWFYAREGPLAIGTPFEDDPALSEQALPTVTRTQAMLVMRNPEHGDGAH
jgi:hypothetical protein